jgi:hypothetical protein
MRSYNGPIKRQNHVYTWTQSIQGRTVRCVVATHSRVQAGQIAGLDRITASLELGQTINPVFVTQALEHVGRVLVFEGESCRLLEVA